MTRSAIRTRAPRASAPAIGLTAGGLLVWGLLGAAAAPPPALLTAASAVSSECQPLPAEATASASPDSSSASAVAAASGASPAELCVSVQNSQSSDKPGHTASFSVQVSAENGPVSGVSVTLSSAPSGLEPVFTGMCPSGDGSGSCTIGSLATTVTPSSYQMQAQIAVASSIAPGTSVTLTATADAATSPPMTAMPAATGSVTVTGPPPSASPSPSPSRTPTAAASATPPTALPTLAPLPAAVTTTGSVISPGNLASILPEIAPSPIPTLGVLPSSAADVETDPATKAAGRVAGNFTLVMPAVTAEVLGLIILAVVISLATTKLAANGNLTVRRRPATEDRARDSPAKKRPRAGTSGRRPACADAADGPARGRTVVSDNRPVPKEKDDHANQDQVRHGDDGSGHRGRRRGRDRGQRGWQQRR